MPDIFDIAPAFGPIGRTNIKILMVVDGSIRTVETPSAFGIGRVARLIDNLSRGCSSFTVHTARRSPHSVSAENQGHISTSFKFDDESGGDPVIDDYDQIWMFGIRGEGSGTLTQSEHRVLTNWMNNGGGIFATGDHFDLGAGMCAGIPRVREMRRWTTADGVPPQGGFDRLDTNRPENDAEATGASPLEFADERDTTPQIIDWIPVSSVQSGFLIYERPHEVLCHPRLGPINVMPDHPHEGRTKDLNEIDFTRSYNFGDGVAGDDFPSSGGEQSKPMVIARGETFPAPPSSKPYKGDAGYFEFPMISIYDGRFAGVKGRVATDSTWHHWFDLNIYELEQAADKTAWKKIARYFENLAVWLSPPGRFRENCWFIHQWFEYPFVEEFNLSDLDVRADGPELGRVARQQFQLTFGPCVTARYVWETLCRLTPRVCKSLDRFEPRLPEPRPGIGPECLSCPPFELLEEAVFEGLMVGAVSFMTEFRDDVERVAKLSPTKLDKSLDAHFAPAVEECVKRYAKTVTDDLQRELKAWQKAVDAKPLKANRKRAA